MTRITPSPYQGQFSGGPEFAAGSVRGIRVWTVQNRPDLNGYCLVGSFHGVWHDGENLAECLVDKHLRHSPAGFLRRRTLTDDEIPTRCSGMEPDCTCGFYAYWEWRPRDYGHGAFYHTPYVVGIVEGYGKTVLGALGFRCEKAKIVALSIINQDFVPPEMIRKRLVALRVVAADRHPGIPLYESVEAMLADHPPDDPPEGVTAPSDHLDPGAVVVLVAAAGLLGGAAALGSAIEWAAKRLRRK